MIFKFPWLKNRKIITLSLSIDLILVLLLNFKIVKYIFLNYLNIFFLMILIWLFSSYIIGRYHENFRNSIRYFSSHVFKTLIIFVMLYILLKINIIFDYRLYDLVLISKIKILNLIKISLIISFVQLFLKILLKDRRKLIFICDPKEYDFLKKIESFKKKSYLKNYVDINNLNIQYVKELNRFNTVILSSITKTNLLIQIKRTGINCQTFNSWCEENLFLIPVKFINDKEILSIENLTSQNQIQNRIKKIGDFTFSLLLLIVSIPFILFAALIIKIEDKGPVFFTQTRTGFNTNQFKIFKLRTMSDKSKNIWAKFSDPRITKIGKFLRKIHLDELPQLINVLKGEMSLIGPRPEIPSIENKLLENIQNYFYRYSVRPGLSGWAQVNYKYGNSIEDTEIKLSYDFYYIKNYSLGLDLLILMKTLRQVLTAKGSIAKV